MIINLSPGAYNKARQSGDAQNKTSQQFVEDLVNTLLSIDSAYLIFQPTPEPQKMQALLTLADIVINKPFFGLKFLTQGEALQHAAEVARETEFNRQSHDVQQFGDDWACQVCNRTEEQLNEPCDSLFDIVTGQCLKSQPPDDLTSQGFTLYKKEEGVLTDRYIWRKRKGPTKLTDAEIIATQPTQGDKVIQFPRSGAR